MSMAETKRDVLGHWVLAMAVILVAATLSIPQIDRYMLGFDAAHSMGASGLAAERPFSPADVLNRISTASPDQGPLYFLLLNQWGYLVGNEIALARVLTIFCALLSLAMVYRLGHDAVSPLAGNFAAIILASNAFYAFYLAHVRFYPLLVLLSTIIIWFYLRIAVVERGGRGNYLALVFACAALICTHAYGLLIYIVCALYHILFVRKNRRWLLVLIAAAAGLALAGPLIFIMLTRGADFAISGHGSNADPLGEIFATWFYLTANGSPVLLLLVAAGAATGWRRKLVSLRRWTILFLLLLLGIALVAVVTRILDVGLMRHLLPGFPIAVLFQAAGLYALYRERKLLGALVCLWVIAGLSFSSSADWKLYIQGRIRSFELPPWHLVSRVARQSSDPARVIGYMLPEKMVTETYFVPGSLIGHWFLRQDVEFRLVGSAKWLEEHLRLYRGSRHSPWLAYQKSRTDEAELAELEATMDELGFRACQQESLPVSTEMVKYSWVALDCQPTRLSVSNQMEPLRYEFYGAESAPDGSRLFFASKWTSRNQETLDHLKISHQLISTEWRNAAQLDRQLTREGELQQFAIDLREVPPGNYRLLAIVYNRHTGETLDWQEAPGNPPSMLYLREVEIR